MRILRGVGFRVLASVFVILLAAALLLFLRTRSMVEAWILQNAEAYQLALVETESARLAGVVGETALLAVATGNAAEIRNLLQKANDEAAVSGAEAFLQGFLNENPEFENIAVIGADFRVRLGMSRSVQAEKLSGYWENMFVRGLDPFVAMTRMPVFIDTVTAFEPGDSGYLRYTVPVLADDRTILGILAMEFPVSRLVARLNLADRRFEYAVFDERGTVLLCGSRDGQPLLREQESMQRILRSRLGSMIEEVDGGRLVVHSRLLPEEQTGLHLTLVQVVPLDYLYAPIHRLTRALAVGVSGVFAAAFLAMVLFVWGMVNPLLLLSAAMDKYRPGRRALIDKRFLRRGDEVGILYRSFQEMADELESALQHEREQVQELEEKNRELARLTREAQELARAKSDFLAIMSHEIRTPLNAMIGFSNLLAEETDANEQRFYIDRIGQAGDRLLALIDNILDFTQLQSGRVKLLHEPFVPRVELSLLVDGLRNSIPAGGPQLRFEFQGAIDAEVMGDVVRMRQIVNNLLSNAIKFTEKGEIVLSAHLLSEYNGQPLLEVCCRDSGPGIPADKQNIIFKPFEQGDTSRTRRYGGSGIGLAIVTKLTEVMGGSISLQSEEGKGSVFTVRIPFRESEQAAPVSSLSVLPSGPSPTGCQEKNRLAASPSDGL